MAEARGLEARRPRDLLGRILETPDLARVVQSLEPAVLHRLIRKCGLEDSGQIVALATTEQLMRLFDDDLWRANEAGAMESFDADRFGLWLEVLVEAGADLAARKLVEMDFDFVTAALSLHLFVLDSEWATIERAAAEVREEYEDPLLEARLDQVERAIDSGPSLELSGFRVVARGDRSWDALIALLASLNADHPAYLGKLMARLGALSTEYIEDNGGLYEVLMTGEQVLADVAGGREERREQEGYVTPPEAAAFLELARQPFAKSSEPPAWDPVTVRYFRRIDERVASESEPPSDSTEREVRRFLARLENEGVLPAQRVPLLPAGVSSERDRCARIRAELLSVQERDADAYARRTDELGYLANVLIAGCSFQSRRFRPVEAADAALAVCNLGLENWPRPAGPGRTRPLLVEQELVTVFRKGWSILHERVSLDVARGLVAVLAGLKADVAEIQQDLVKLHRRLASQLEAGTPWRERDNLDVIAVLDPPSWSTLVGLLDECPVAPKLSETPARMRPLRVTTEFEFISENSQIAWAHDFIASLRDRLVS